MKSAAGTANYQVVMQPGGDIYRCASQNNLLQSISTAKKSTAFHEVIPVGCRGGGCGICKIKVLTGVYNCGIMSKKHITDKEREAGFVLACRTYPQSDLCITRQF